MSLKETKKISTNRYELTITIDGETFSEAIKTVYVKKAPEISIKGFRKGKAPLSYVEKYYGEGVFYEDALNLLYGDALESAANEAGLTIIDDEMKFDLVKIGRDGVEFKVELTTKPEVTVSDYKGLKAEKVVAETTEDEIKAEIDRMAERNSRMESVEGRASKNGDITVIDFEGFVDGVAFEGGKGEGFSLTLGSGQFIPGFEEQVENHNIGDEFDVNVTFPEDYGSEELAGKAAVFKCKLHEIKEKILPEIDDEFAKDVSEFDTLDELKADIKAKADERKNVAAEQDVENQLMEALVANMEGEIPEAMFENRVTQSVNDFDYRLQMQGMKLDLYLQYTGSTMEDFRKSMRPQAENQVKVRLALEKVAELENIVLTDAEIDEQFERLAAQYNVDIERVKAAIPAAEVAKDLSVEKAIEVIKNNAEIKEVKEKTAVKKAAPKATKKKAEGEAEEKPAAKKTTSTAKKTTSTAKKTTSTTKKPAAKKTETKADAE